MPWNSGKTPLDFGITEEQLKSRRARGFCIRFPENPEFSDKAIIFDTMGEITEEERLKFFGGSKSLTPHKS